MSKFIMFMRNVGEYLVNLLGTVLYWIFEFASCIKERIRRRKKRRRKCSRKEEDDIPTSLVVCALMVGVVTIIFASVIGNSDSVAGLEAEYFTLAEEASIDDELLERNKIVDVWGYVSSVRFVDSGYEIVLDKKVACYFEGDDIKTALHLSMGDPVTIRGRCQGRNPYNGYIELSPAILDF